ncbi:MAG: hypothetical protein ACD_83C00017G0003 [uncultured bacterium]|uniref:Ham1 family protein n=1 Tax=Berkelbacteria bacterium GW2011_GWA2_38_9 TaxID=1618334 RepID=A0A0G0LHG8_9BACT|nr:MAG: hypothetical protein ACD_83C00017G0003 [uncultured bacterium]KKQ90507.1 MAG: Ham1 family protein [Berkelbacteria bacterium GW2011_GWA2_38_9]
MSYFITGNKNKFQEAKLIIPQLEQLDIDLPEIQEIDPQKVIEAKLKEAGQHHDGQLIVEDTGLYIKCLDGLPGPLIKWFHKTVGYPKLAELVFKYPDHQAEAKAVIGYFDQTNIRFFEGVISGQIVLPRGETNFGWDIIFQPDRFDKTFAEMTIEEKNKISHRRLAFEKLKEYLRAR